MTKEQKSIYIKGARVHNLKNIEVEIPHNRLVVITGLSGSGKSTLAFDTIFAEGQRRYVESLSAYARQFLGKINKPDVDVITGIAPAIAIEQKVNTRNPRSTVGTTTELYDYLKLLYARIGHTFSPVSGQEVKCYTEDDVAQYILSLPEGSRVAVAAPLQLREGQGVIEKLTLVLGEGILRVHAAGETLPIEDFLPRVDENTRAEDISIVVDRAKVSQDGDLPTRLRDSVARAFSYGNGVCRIVTPEGVKEFSARFEADGIEFEPPTEHLFSFNNPLGACPTCEGYGKIIGIDEDLVIPDKRKTIYEDAVACWRGETMRAWKDQLVANAYKFDFPIHTPFYQLTAEQKRLLWCGNEYFHGLNDFFAYIDSERRKIQFRVMKARYTGKTVCPDCGGSRLRKEALYVRVGGKTIADLEGQEFLCEYSAKTDPLGAIKENPISHVSYSYGAQVIILNEQGRIEKAVSAFDVGTPVNIQSVEGQIEGGMVMGIGYGVTEKFECVDGYPKSRFGTIGFMRATEAPELEVILCQPKEADKLPFSLGAKGCGELCMIPTAPACAHAYYRLDGKFRQSLPLSDTPYRK